MQNDLSDTVCNKYPTPNSGTIPKIVSKLEYTPREFLERAKEQWIAQTSTYPGQAGEDSACFRKAVMAGLPEQVRTKLQRNPDFAVANSTKWERHIIRRLQLELDVANQKRRELEKAQAQLLKLQLSEARQKVGKKKKDSKEGAKKMMVVRPSIDPVPDWLDLDPNLYADYRLPGHGLRQGNWGT